MKQPSLWISAEEALVRLAIKPQTLYASVSRGRIRSRAHPDDSRRSLYSAEDVERLAKRRSGRPAANSIAAEAIHWGEPVLTSSVSTVEGGRLYYRRHDAVDLAEKVTLEQTAALLWACSGTADMAAVSGSLVPATDLAPAFAALAARAAGDAPSYGRSRAVLREEAGSVWRSLVSPLIGLAGADRPVHERLAEAWRCPGATDVLRRALVLLADHELNASTFAARVAASTGAPLSAGALAGLCTLIGPRHGGAAAELQALIRHAEAESVAAAVRDWLGQGRRVPAFGHRFYPAGDVRAAALLEHLPLPPVYSALRENVEGMVGDAPNIDFALAAMTAAFRLPAQAPLLLFALARCVGWLAHMLEQASSGELIRPRALYDAESVLR